MESNDQDCWLTRIDKIENILKLNNGSAALISKGSNGLVS